MRDNLIKSASQFLSESDYLTESTAIKGTFYISTKKKPGQTGASNKVRLLKELSVTANGWKELAKKLADEFDTIRKTNNLENTVDGDGYAVVQCWYKTETITVDGWNVEIQVQDKVRALVEGILKYPTAEYDEPWRIKKIGTDV